jgi:hypothetical protein
MSTGALGTGMVWTNSAVTFYFGAAIGVILVIGFVTIFVRMHKIHKEYRETLAKKYSTGDIICHDNSAHYFGMELFKGKQNRGKGVLVLAHNELYFLKLLPKIELCIPLKRIKRCVATTNFLGKSVHKPLLKVDFNDEDGALNSVAWHVKNLVTFENSLKLQRKKNRPKKRK